jgi:hypothetical protein
VERGGRLGVGCSDLNRQTVGLGTSGVDGVWVRFFALSHMGKRVVHLGSVLNRSGSGR